ncbi:MAG: S-layer homology domain-containing protein [Clostridia bacterium]|nr:S-layer homology domain-containing protein [Clostridia bacterium]
MKRVVALILICALTLISTCINVFAEDMSKHITELTKYNIIKGDPDGNMRLADHLTRAEAVTLIVRMYGFSPETSMAAPANEFSDMEGHWACNAAMIAKGLRVIEENEKIFAPEENIKSEEFIKMIVTLLGYKEVAEQKGGNPVGYLMTASQIGVTKGVSIATGRYITRDNAAKMLFNSFDVPLMVQTVYGENNEYAIMDGKDGRAYQTLRTMFETGE